MRIAFGRTAVGMPSGLPHGVKAMATSDRHRSKRMTEIVYARSRALLIAAAGLPPVERVAFLLDRGADLYSDLAEVLAPLDPVEVDQLVERYGESAKAGDLIRLLSLIHASPGVGSWDWFVDRALDAGFDASGTANRLLWIADRVRFGRDLQSRAWSWGADRGDWDNHYGSLALAEANVGLPFEDTLVRIAPWLVPHAVVLRGSDPADADLAAQLLAAGAQRAGPWLRRHHLAGGPRRGPGSLHPDDPGA